MKTRLITLLAISYLAMSCKPSQTPPETTPDTPFVWEAANVYFLLTDRFNNGDPTNDVNFDRTEETAVLRGFEGGDFKGVTQKIKEGYFTDLGIQALWMTPWSEQIHQVVDEGTGATYGYHGYWAKDWTAIDPNFGTREDLEELIQTAHDNGIRIIMDVVLNHTGPETEKDPFWGDDWARRDPNCTYQDADSTIKCSLVENLPDILTESTKEVGLPAPLAAKWKAEGRYDEEVAELDAFFKTSGLKRTPRNYIIKWLSDYVRELGVDGYRVDTTKHVEEDAWAVTREQAEIAFADWKKNNPEKALDDTPFYMFGEVYFYSVDNGQEYNLGDKTVNYFENGFDGLINFQFKYDAKNAYETTFAKYDTLIHKTFKGKSFVNYATSHDDGDPFDKKRIMGKRTGTMLMLTQGLSQVYYGDETNRDLTIEGTNGDATLRSFMNWEDLDTPETKALLAHWQKLGQFRANHPAIGAGKHQMLSEAPYVFKRTYKKGDFTDTVVIGLDLPAGEKVIDLGGAFAKAQTLTDTYSGQTVTVVDGKVRINSPFDIVLLQQ